MPRIITTIVATAAAVTLPMGGTPTGPTAVAAPATTTTVATARAVTPSVKTSYLVATRSRGTARLQLVDRATGVTTATLVTRPLAGFGHFADATIAGDGSVWVVEHGAKYYDTTLLRIKNGAVTEVMPYVTTARVSPDGRRIAVTVQEPDFDRDGFATSSVRVGPVTSTLTALKVLSQAPVEVDAGSDDRAPTALSDTSAVQAWLGNDHLAVTTWHNRTGNVDLVSARSGRTTASVTGPDPVTEVVGIRGADAYLPVAAWNAGGKVTGYDVYRLSATRSHAVKVGRVGLTASGRPALAPFLRKVGATPTQAAGLPLRYRPVEGVTLDATFQGI
ncbi:hypothetical protein [Arsenicicoccus dermatophilus]|uniref:hypothetical protein n=1 Tax=Arsenicicoccus dermatophilus TaxID=1076331 RepID=UPI0039171F7C